MKRNLLTLLMMLALLGSVNAQIISDDFDAYTADSLVAIQSGGVWTTWSDAPGSGEDAFVSSAQAYSGDNSIVLELASTDLVLPFGNLTSGSYEYGSKMYFPAGSGGYFNLMHEFDAETAAYEWAIDIFFNGDGTGTITAGGTDDVTFTYSEDMWIDVSCIIDLDGDLAQMWIEGMMVREWQWSLIGGTGAAGLNQLAVADFYPAAVAGAQYYIDDVYFMEAEPLVYICFMPDAMICDDFDNYMADSLMALQSMGTWTTWSDAPGSGEDAFVSSAQAYSGDNSIVLELASTDLVLPFGNLTSGSYEYGSKMYFPAGSGGYFNLMHEFDAETAAYEWAIDIFFNGDGTGTITAGGTDDVTFAYTEDMWIDANCIIDLNADLAQMWIEGVMVREWQWSLVGGTGDAGLNQLAVADFYPAAVTGALFYVDNVYFVEAEPLDYSCFMPSAILCDDYDDYMADSLVALQSDGLWTTWSDAPGSGEDAFVSSVQAFSGDNSIVLELASTDLVLPFGDLTSGSYEYGSKMYFPAGSGGYFNLMHEFDAVGAVYEWAIDIFFNGDGTGSVTAGGTDDATFTYSEDMWIDANCIIDLDNDWAEMWIEGVLVREWQWSLVGGTGDAGLNQLAVADFYPAAVAGAQFYVDNVYFIPADALTPPSTCFMPDAMICDDFDAYISDTLVALQSAGLWTTWSDAPGSAEDANVSSVQAFSGDNSIVLELASTDLVLPFGDLTSGSYEYGSKMYFPAGHGGYFNLMHEFDAVGAVYEWAIDIFFNGDGTGSVTAGGTDDATFTYSEDTWIDANCRIDLDNDWAEMWIEGVMVREWQWSLVGGTGDAGLNQLAVADFYPAAVAGAQFYVDNVYFDMADPLTPPVECFMPEAMICDDMDSYIADSLFVAAQSDGIWTTWSDAPGSAEDAYVSSAQSFSGNNSIVLELASTDLVLPFGNLTTGSYEYGSKMYFPAGHGGYFNLMHEFDAVGAVYEWAIDIFFNGDGTGTVTAGGTDDVTFTYSENMWIDANCFIDLDNDWAQMWIEGVMVREWQWSLVGGTGDAGLNQLAVADFYPAAVAGAQFYVDNVFFRTSDPLPFSVGEIEVVDFGVYPNPSNGSFTIVNNSVTSEYTIQLIDVIGRNVYSQTVNMTRGNAIQVNTGITASGIYSVKMINNTSKESSVVQLIIE